MDRMTNPRITCQNLYYMSLSTSRFILKVMPSPGMLLHVLPLFVPFFLTSADCLWDSPVSCSSVYLNLPHRVFFAILSLYPGIFALLCYLLVCSLFLGFCLLLVCLVAWICLPFWERPLFSNWIKEFASGTLFFLPRFLFASGPTHYQPWHSYLQWCFFFFLSFCFFSICFFISLLDGAVSP